MKKWLAAQVLFIVVAGCYFFPFKPDIVSRRYPAAQLQADFRVFRTLLEKGHPGLYTYASKAEMDHCFDSLYATLKESMDIREFHRDLSYLLDKIGCSHTNVYLPQTVYDSIYHRTQFFPIPLVFVDGGLYINSDNFPIPLGSHIISINGHQAGEIMDRILHYNVPDGRNRNYNLSQAAADFAYDYFLAYGPAEDFQVEFAIPGSAQNQQQTLRPTSLDKYLENYNFTAYYSFSTEIGYDFEIVDSIQTAILTLRSFSFGTASTFAAYKNFLNNAFTLLKSQPDIHNLVIDVRNNTGGEYENIFLLYRYLTRNPFREVDSATVRFDSIPFSNYLEADYAANEKPALDSMIAHDFCRLSNGESSLLEEDNTLRRPHPMAFDGKVYVITNSNVLSAAANFVAMMKDSRRGIIVGDETGGGYNSHNGFSRVLYQLPNTGMRLEYSAVRVQYYLQHPQLNQFGVVPDYPVSASLEDVINNQDPQLSFVLGKLIGEGD